MPSPDPAPEAPLIPATCSIHPECNPTSHSLSPAQLEDIFYESRSHNGCCNTLTLYQESFDLCPPDQELEIQIKNEEPVLVKIFPRLIIEFKMTGPKIMNCESLILKEGGATYVTGGEKQTVHGILGFPAPGTDLAKAFLDDFLMVDMTCMQWGERGMFGENYFLGRGGDWQDSMGNVCYVMQELGIGASWIKDSPHTELMRKCAKRVWDRWVNRENAGWCENCGVGGKLSACGGCRGRQIW